MCSLVDFRVTKFKSKSTFARYFIKDFLWHFPAIGFDEEFGEGCGKSIRVKRLSIAAVPDVKVKADLTDSDNQILLLVFKLKLEDTDVDAASIRTKAAANIACARSYDLLGLYPLTKILQ